jgi:alcohol dehydrogenase class IV
MHHGLANAIMIPYGMEFNASVSEDRMKTICEVIGLKERSSQSFINWLRELNAKIGIPKDLSSQKVTKDHLPRLADLAMKDPCHPCNPRPVTKEDFLAIYQKALGA